DQQQKRDDPMRQETTQTDRTGATGTSTSSVEADADAALPLEPLDSTGVRPAQLANDRLESEIIGLVTHLSNATYDLLRLIGEHDDRGAYLLTGALSCAAWLADRCDIERVTAHNQVRVARAMREYPELDTAMACGDVSYAKARMLVAHLSVEHAEELVHLASVTPTSGLATALACWSHRTETQDDIDARHHTERCVSWRTEADGMVRITARLAPADAAGVCAMIDKTVTVTPMGATDHSHRNGPSLAQQRADALVTVVTQAGTATVDAEVVVHVTQDGNTLADGTPLTDNAVTRLLPDAFISLLLSDNARQPIDASPRRRHPTRRQRRVIDARQDECQEPGCHARAQLEYDHKQPYPLGGPTILDNLQRLCGPHNRAKYQAEIDAKKR
ncbi:MAG TPA: DUF222 domain-containing protein, partial [Acidimicrobiales bacterium]|nr:DUF222 domain-containing protein [Acidimicrobiales bacterium]